MDKNTQFEYTGYIPPKANIIYINCQKVLCQS